jgi:hypothetical protein
VFKSWDEAKYELGSLNMVTIKKGKGDVGIMYTGEGRVKSRAIPKSNDNPEGFTEEDYYLIISCTCNEWQRTKLRCLHALCVLHDMGKIDIHAENASLATVQRPGRRKHRGLWYDKVEDDTVSRSYPSKYPEGIVNQHLSVDGHVGMGMITCEFFLFFR